MKKAVTLLILLLVTSPARADLILLKNGEIIEGKIVDVRGIFVRVLDNYDSPFKEFLMEDIVNIEPSSPDEASQMSIRNLHQRALNRAQSSRIEQAVTKRASQLLEEAINKSDAATLDRAPEPVKYEAKKKASAIIEEAVKTAETPRLDQVSYETKQVAEEKAGNVIEQALKTVEVFPLQKAPQRVQAAAKKAASVLVGEASKVSEETQKSWFSLKDVILAVLIVGLFFLLYREKTRGTQPQKKIKSKALKSSLREIDEELKKFGGDDESEPAAAQEGDWAEKRAYKRFHWNFPIALRHKESDPVFAMVKNVSVGGAFADCNEVDQLRAIGESSQFRFRFTSNDPNFPIQGEAVVVRIRSNRGLGLKFYDLDDKSAALLKNLS